MGADAVAREAEGGVGGFVEDRAERSVSTPEPAAGRRCEICHTLVPADPMDEQLGEMNGYPCSLIAHRWSAHGIVWVTRCPQCALPIRTDSLGNHLSLEHDLPPPSDAERAQYEAERRIRAEVADVGATATESAQKIDQKIDQVKLEIQRLPAALFWTIVTAVIVAQLLVPVVKALIASVLEAIGARLR